MVFITHCLHQCLSFALHERYSQINRDLFELQYFLNTTHGRNYFCNCARSSPHYCAPLYVDRCHNSRSKSLMQKLVLARPTDVGACQHVLMFSGCLSLITHIHKHCCFMKVDNGHSGPLEENLRSNLEKAVVRRTHGAGRGVGTIKRK